MKRILLFLWALALIADLSACVPVNEATGGEISAQITQSPTLTNPGLQTSSATPTQNIPVQTILPTFTPPATIIPTPRQVPTCLRQGGRYEYGSLQSELLPLPLEYAVYIPPCYDSNQGQRYPVLYLIHGQSYTHDQWDRLGIDEVADHLIAMGELAPFMIILPRDRSWTQPTQDGFGEALATDLLPHIDSVYRTLPDRAYRAIGGLSRGAAWAIHLGLSRWELFGAIGAHSLPIFWSDAPQIPEWLDAIPVESLPRIYLDIGEKDRPEILESAIWFENLLVDRNIPHQWHLFPGYHEEDYWSTHVEQYLRWYAQEW